MHKTLTIVAALFALSAPVAQASTVHDVYVDGAVVPLPAGGLLLLTGLGGLALARRRPAC